MHEKLGLLALLLLSCGGEVAVPEGEAGSVEQAFTFHDYPCAVPEVMPETGQVGDLRPRHDIRGYLNGSSAVANEYLLEEGVTLRATQASCLPTTVPTGYFVEFSVAFIAYEEDGHPTVLFTGKPMGSEAMLPRGDFRSLDVIVHQQLCTNMSGGTVCQNPTIKAKRTYKIAVQPRSTFCVLEFSRTEFSREDTDLTVAESAYITKLDRASLAGLTENVFRSRGVSTANAQLVNGQAQKPFIDVSPATTFGVHSWEPCLGDTTTAKSGCSLQRYNVLGESDTFRPHALRFARVDGMNTITKLPYSYTCGQPSIVRDRIAACGAGSMPDTYYRLPFFPNQRVDVIQGNCGSGTHSCDGFQRYALDFGADKGTAVLAARGGVVAATLDTQGNCTSEDNCDDKGFDRGGNFVIVQHQDNTFGVYGHLEQGSVVVSVGDTVKRGAHLADSGNSGLVNTPHLHFHVRRALSLVPPGGKAPSIEASYEYFINEPLTVANRKSCRIPAEDGDHWSYHPPP